jgi:tetratricopeptide (TPR) repeat protein
MTRKTQPRTPALFRFAVAAVLAAAPAVRADVKGTITTTEGRKMQGEIRWQPASRKYVISAGGYKMDLQPAQVASVEVQKPAEIDGAVAQVSAGKYAQAVPTLEKIAADYQMLQWDAIATRYLAYAYLKMGRPQDAIKKCEIIIRDKPQEAFLGEMAPVYWDSLLEANQLATLRRVLSDATQKGNRKSAALAQIKRGDIEKKQGNLKDALVDGYLRVVLLFVGVDDAQPEALYKAMKTFEELGQSAYAEKMRKKLLGEYARSEYAQMLKSGM